MVQLAKGIEDAEAIVKDLEKDLSDTYFCNFSVFQSLPDSWALEQVFPVMPIQRLNERPDRKAVLVDLTCDSDGHITNFIDIDNSQIQNHLAVHAFRKGDPYYIGVFLAGAYQEILGDLHNLFGDTDAVYVSTTPNGYSIDHVVEGDAVTDVLSFVEYSKPELLERVRKATETGIVKGTLSPSEARLLLKHYEQGLSGYTYLFEE
jgi:arginine decarboxylase